MTGFILAGALGAIALFVFLLFRQLRQLSWQLTQLRVERDSDEILRDIGLCPQSRSAVGAGPVTEPVRRKRGFPRHLGGLSAALARIYELGRAHRHTAAVTVAVTAITIAWTLISLCLCLG